MHSQYGGEGFLPEPQLVQFCLLGLGVVEDKWEARESGKSL